MSRPDRLSSLKDDPYLDPYRDYLVERRHLIEGLERRLTCGGMSMADFACAHEYYGLHRHDGGWVFREWAPHATAIFLVGDFSDWKESAAYRLSPLPQDGDWEIRLPPDTLAHGHRYRLRVYWPEGSGDRIPAYTRRVVQDPHTLIFNAQVWCPEHPYVWRHTRRHPAPVMPLIYEAHVGMAQEREGIGTYDEFREHTLPRIAAAGYNMIQLMAIMEHPYYGSFGYHVSSYFAATSRFGTPDELKALIDAAHELGIGVIIDLVHSHAVDNDVEGLSCFDGTPYQYFHDGPRGRHPAWGSRCFDYGKINVLHMLLSNCRFWLDEYHLDGFRFDGVTSMLFDHHGLGVTFDSYDPYFSPAVDLHAYAYLALANKLIHQVNPDAMTIAEDVSGMPGLAAPLDEGGCAFDYRLAMGVPDCWFKLAKDIPDEHWNMHWLWHELTNRRNDERTISYVESHDQAIVGSKTMIFQLIDAAMYTAMSKNETNLAVDRGMALHKMIRLATLTTAGHGYLTFMGNEFGHPEWIDFPREGNGWSFRYARRQWHLRDDPELRYHFLADFDRAMLDLFDDPDAFAHHRPRLQCIHDADKILVFERAGVFVLLNFNPGHSVVDYAIDMPEGVYELVLNTDEPRFGGFNRIAAGQRFQTVPLVSGADRRHVITVYLPCRCAMVLKTHAPPVAPTGANPPAAPAAV